ncbi:hypothetical protein B0H16DRAFT_1694899 [Mycena metata]|uniref:Uncharacterized protein n=1 Tax=Mycena metata TaxID=1033252 RepID=A0AAD7MYS0_9AGAR|nr:hypothetical protein B0H16DRAFT_1694899 [Mycena metata]
MFRQPTMTEIRLKNISTCVAITASTLNVLVTTFEISALKAILNTTQSLLEMVEDTPQDPYFQEAQQSTSKIKKFLRQGELSVLLNGCKEGLQQGLDFFQGVKIKMPAFIMVDAREMQDQERLRHQEILDIIETISGSDSASSIDKMYSGSYTRDLSFNSISMLPAEPRIFHGRDSELAEILKLFNQGTPRIAILVELAGLIGTHLGMKPGKDLTQAVLWHFTDAPPSLLILDNLETQWELVESRKEIEEFLSLLMDITSLALLVKNPAQKKQQITMHSMEEVDQVLHLTDNMPLAISLLAHLVDMEDCSTILAHWEGKKTSLISEGSDRQFNLELSISLSFSSPRITSMPHSQDLLALLSILPDGLSDVEFRQSKFPINDILGCKTALLRTALAYTDDHKHLKALVPVREYMGRCSPPTDPIIRPLLAHFHELLELHVTVFGKESGAFPIARITSNYINIQNVLQHSLQLEHPDMSKSIYCTCDFNSFSRLIGRGPTVLMENINHLLPLLHDHRLKTYFIIELFSSFTFHPISHPEVLITQALNHFKHSAEPDLNTNRSYRDQCAALGRLSWIEWLGGDYTAARAYAQEAQRMAKLSGELFQEAAGLYYEAARKLFDLCGMHDGELNYALRNCQAEVHQLKSEYTEAHLILNQHLQEVPSGQNLYNHGVLLANIAEIEVFMGAPNDVIQKKIDTSKAIFERQGHKREVIFPGCYQAALNLREGDTSSLLFCQYVRVGWGNFSDVVSFCLERLGDISCWEGSAHAYSWTTVFLAHSLKGKQRLGIYKALQYLGDVFCRENDDEVTATSLFTLALDGFTYMDVHCSRAECMIRLGDIAKKNGDLLKALELWETAKPLFECSSQAKRVQDIDERVDIISEETKEQHQKNLARLAELNVPAGKVEEVDSDNEELGLEEEQVKLITV